MNRSGDIAYAHARMRAWRSRLLRRPDVMPLLAANDAASHARALAAIGAATDGEALEHALQRLLQVYRIAIRGYRAYALLFIALLRLHEVENLKLAWRAIARHVHEGRWHSLWRPLGSLGSVTLEQCRSAESLRDLAERLEDTPYGQIVATLHRAHGDDITAFELGLDRWASGQLLAEAAKLPASEALSRAILEEIVRRRDAQLAERGASMYGLSVAPPTSAVPRRRGAGAPLPYSALLRRASRGGPFSLAPALAVVLLAEEELRGVIALTERHGRAELDAPVARVLEPSLMGT
jgi:vacuolar-type H+-ATPase subunit C/Vma6